MKNKKKQVVFGLTAVFCAIVTVCFYIWGAELCEMFPYPEFSTKIEIIKITGIIATISSAFIAIKQ